MDYTGLWMELHMVIISFWQKGGGSFGAHSEFFDFESKCGRRTPSMAVAPVEVAPIDEKLKSTPLESLITIQCGILI